MLTVLRLNLRKKRSMFLQSNRVVQDLSKYLTDLLSALAEDPFEIIWIQ